MLRIFIDNVNDEKMDIVHDVEELFLAIKVTGTELERNLIEKLEHGKYNDENSFIDRFGYKLRYDDMSTGCKAALCVANCIDKIIDLRECGYNARDVIIETCKDGNVLITDACMTFADIRESICVIVDDYKITSTSRLNKYVFEERPFTPDMTTGGIEHV